MKLKLFLSVLCLFLLSHSALSQKSGQVKMPVYPLYSEVIDKFLTEYLPGLDENQQVFALAKKTDGWHATTLSYPDNKVINDELFWARNGKKYLKLKFPKNQSGTIDENYLYLKNNWSAETFSAMVPYWGYDGWETDVITEFAEKPNLSDTLLNAVARSYSSKARNLISISEFGSPDNYNKLPKGQNALNPEILSNYLNLQHKSIEFYNKLYKQNPLFETFVANSYIIYSNEILNGFLTLRYFQNDQTAKKELKPSLYNGFYLEMARNILNSCDLNAILFVNGDMDTYPLLYVQEMENFRQDVLVVNLSLINLGRYINQLANFRAGAKPLKTAMDTTIYKNEINPYFMIQEVTEEFLPIGDIIKSVSAVNPQTEMQITDYAPVNYIPSRHLYFNLNKENLKNEFNDVLSKTDTAIHIKLSNYYLTVGEFATLDVIAKNNFERPVYFATTVARESFLGLENNFQLEGMAYKLTPIKTENPDKFEVGRINSDVLYKKFIEKLSFNQSNYARKDLSDNEKQIISTYQNSFSRLASKLITDNKPEWALEILNKYVELFPEVYVPYNYNLLPVITGYFKIGKKETAKNLVEKYSNSIIPEIDQMIKLKNTKNEQELRRQITILNELLRISEQYIADDDLTKKLKQSFKKYESYYFY